MANEVPRATDAERSVLGSLLIHGASLLEVADWLTPDDFLVPACRLAYAAALALFAAQSAVDLVTLTAALERRNELARVGGPAWLAGLVEAVPVAQHIAHYGRLVQAAAERRRLLQAGGEIARIAHAGAGDGDELRAQALAVLLQSGRRTDRTVDGPEASSRLLAELGQLARQETTFPTFGLPSLDAVLLLRPGSLTFLGAFTSQGKTALALTMARHNAQAGQQILYVSTEMRPEDLQRRQTCYYTGLPFRVLCGRLDEEQLARVAGALGEIGAWPGSIAYLGGVVALERLRLEALARRAQGQLDLLVVDYLQKVVAPGKSIYEQVSRASNACQELAAELQVPVLVVSQLSRKTLTKDEPMLDDLSDSGVQEKDADAVLLLRTDPTPNLGSDKFRPVNWFVRKNRNGGLGQGSLLLDTVRFTFEELD